MTDPDPRRRKLRRALTETFRGRLHFSPAERMLFSTDASFFMVEPLGAAVPRDEEDLVAAVKIARDLRIGLHPRGGGTGLAGESLGPGLVLDCHPNFQAIEAIDPSGRTVVAGAGVTLGQLNRALAPFHLKFGPDPASGARANLGGMIGTNATGAHSLEYGYTSDHVRELLVVTADGETVWMKPGALSDLPAAWKNLPPVLENARDRIARAYPKQHRHRSGYNLRGVLGEGTFNPIPLLCGAEGTLGLVVKARLSLVPVPASSAIAMFLFDSVRKAADAIAELMPFSPSALEIIDHQVLEMGREHDPRFHALIPDATRALLLGEWTGESTEEVRDKMSAPIRRLRRSGSPAFEVREAYDAADMATLWLIRKESEALITNRPQPSKAVSVVEDTAVPYERLGEWIETKGSLIERHGFSWATFGHAGAGEMHTKVFVRLNDPKEYVRLAAMMRDVYEAASRIGTISGEHGDGLLRTPFLPLQYPELFDTFARVKAAIDPDSILNPGRKTVRFAEHPAVAHNRLGGRSARTDLRPVLRFAENELAEQSSACHGCGACRDPLHTVRMCPLFKLTHDELASPRAKGNLSRLTLFGPLDPKERLEPAAGIVSDYCFNCRMCRLECPSHVDIPKLMLELKAERARAHGVSAGARLIAKAEGVSRIGSAWPALANRLLRAPALRWATEKLFGVERRAPFFPYESGTFLAKARAVAQPAEGPEVIYYADYHVLYNHHDLGLSFIRLLNRLGCRVIPYTRGGCGMPALDMGLADKARGIVESQAAELARIGDPDLPILCTEPTAALMLREEWPGLSDRAEVRSVAARAQEATAFLLRAIESAPVKPVFRRTPLHLAHHAPCHLKALKQGRPGVKLLSLVPGVSVVPLEEGCCGIAGAYGLFTDNRERSLRIGSDLFAALSRGFDGAVTECSTCRLQIESAVEGLPVLHPIRFLAEALEPV